jgi:hypothetical protein
VRRVRNWLLSPKGSWQWYGYRAISSFGAIAALLFHVHRTQELSPALLAVLIALFAGLGLLGLIRVSQVLRAAAGNRNRDRVSSRAPSLGRSGSGVGCDHRRGP